MSRVCFLFLCIWWWSVEDFSPVRAGKDVSFSHVPITEPKGMLSGPASSSLSHPLSPQPWAFQSVWAQTGNECDSGICVPRECLSLSGGQIMPAKHTFSMWSCQQSLCSPASERHRVSWGLLPWKCVSAGCLAWVCVSPLTRTVRSISMLGKWRHRGFSSPGAFPWPWNVEGHSSLFSSFASLIADASSGRSNLFMHFSSLTVCLKPFLEWWEMSRTFWAQSLQDQAPVWGPERREM